MNNPQTAPLTSFDGIQNFSEYVFKAIEQLQSYPGERVTVAAIREYLERHHLYCTYESVTNILDRS